MNRLLKYFSEPRKNVLNVYCTAGFPELNDTMEVMESLQENGADIIELGIPYSDPLADGPVIQQSSMRSLANGMSLPVLFNQLRDLRKTIKVPVLLMGYLNPILQFGMEKFCMKARDAGIDGLIIPDLPSTQFETEFGKHFRANDLSVVFLVSPDTPESRIRKLDELSSGFIYAVSSSSVTGKAKDLSQTRSFLQNLQCLGLKNPILVGFGISDRQSFELVCEHAQGGIIGSAYIKALSSGDNIKKSTAIFLNSIKNFHKESAD